MNLLYDDPRNGDRYTIELSRDGEFLSGLRFLDGATRDPIHYEKLSLIPQPHRQDIEHLIWSKKHPRLQKS